MSNPSHQTAPSEAALIAIAELADRHDLAAQRAGEEANRLSEESRALADRSRERAEESRERAGEADTLRRRAAEIRGLVARERAAIAQTTDPSERPQGHPPCRNCGGPLWAGGDGRRWEHLLPGDCALPLGPDQPDPTSTVVDGPAGMPVAGRTPPPAAPETGGAL